MGLIQTGDDVRIQFEWVVGAKEHAFQRAQNGLVPLILDLPAPAFKGTPKDLKLGPNVEPLLKGPRAPMMVPSGLENLAPGSTLTCSDKNVPPDNLARLTDGDKDAPTKASSSCAKARNGCKWISAARSSSSPW